MICIVYPNYLGLSIPRAPSILFNTLGRCNLAQLTESPCQGTFYLVVPQIPSLLKIAAALRSGCEVLRVHSYSLGQNALYKFRVPPVLWCDGLSLCALSSLGLHLHFGRISSSLKCISSSLDFLLHCDSPSPLEGLYPLRLESRPSKIWNLQIDFLKTLLSLIKMTHSCIENLLT